MTDDYPAVTARDIAQFLDHLAALRYGAGAEDPAERAAFLAHKAELCHRIADQHAHTDPAYAAQVRQIATDALTAAAEHDRPPVTTTTTVGPTRKRTTHPDHRGAGARPQEKSGATSG